ncbi:MAG: hypothetical protein AAFQ80_14600 [Cyanobacteria bacterium J06621_8]
MSSPERDLQAKLDEMEAEINQSGVDNANDVPKFNLPQLEINPSPQVQEWINLSKKWFQNLPKFGKAAVAIGGVWLGFSVLGAVLHVVSSILSIAAIGLLLYVGYRLFGNKSSN